MPSNLNVSAAIHSQNGEPNVSRYDTRYLRRAASRAEARPIALACNPHLGPAETLVTAAARNAAAKNAKPSLIDIFARPDDPFGILKSGSRYAYFATDGGKPP